MSNRCQIKIMDDGDYKTKPVIKWVGGKTQILDKVFALFPKKIGNYYEPFVGGGSVLIELLTRAKQGSIQIEGKVYAFDLNSPLISLYKHIQKNPRKLIKEINLLKTELEQCSETGVINRSPTCLEQAQENKENYYYYIRTRFNTERVGTIKSSAMFIFLNKTCFRGVYRMGPNGFNVPYGHYKNPAILDAENILVLSELFKDVEFTCCSFDECPFWKKCGKKDFVYLDPPYAPESSKSFVGYNKDGFDLNQHKTLFDLCLKSKIKFLLSNASVPLVLKAFPIDKYNIETISCKRSINSKDPSERTDEVLITPNTN